MAKVEIVLSDFDGTLTFGKQLGPQFHEVLSFLGQKNIDLVIVTGRSLSWAHFLLTHFDLKAVIAEGGGVLVHKDLSKEVFCSEEELRKLEFITRDLLETFKDLRLSEDSFGRLCDRAIELDLLKDLKLKDKVESFLKEKCHFSCSSVHLNYWVGEISKHKASLYYLERLGIDPTNALYFGDAPNDEGMFRYFPHTVGVSNLKDYEKQLKYLPTVIMEGEKNEGPSGVLNYLLRSL